MGKFRDLKPEFEGGNWFSFDSAIDGLAVICAKFIVTRASGATAVVVMSETATGFFSAEGFS